METIDWLWILHPALAVVLIYPLIGMVVRLGIQARQRRVDRAKLPPTTGRDHADLGQWLSAGVVLVVLVALTVVIVTKQPAEGFTGGGARALQLLLVLVGTVVSLLALWQVKAKGYRLVFALLTWAGVLGLGAQPEVWRLSDNPLSAEFWQSHYWAGVGVVGLMIFSLAARPEILKDLRWRRLHLTASALAAVLFLVQGITGSRDLLEIPLSWQKPTIFGCDSVKRVCPPFAPADPAPPVGS
ncbi:MULTISPECIES: DUF4079 domain-containing protein [unclassified Cyanobium]|uniref:DUF4079 domain-containing protein n=1 Tax=unclassified Cyanobium TaxID=2627006 RepID=UPI0020CCC2A8|nr:MULTISPECIES: DUF4079 domain-containing protein [unclassified Cyanobium]MCP9833912.1 DUF4079 domain-containing protein [Cyanobium sp. La Preciosa 7G6]MCP9936676.1 DUF4079 domain-containing protein [Cyanobium sp. Aljojuca 7A6]